MKNLTDNKANQIAEYDFAALLISPHSSQEEINAVRSRVFLLSEKIVCIKEIPNVTPYSVDIIFDKVDEITKGLKEFNIVIDLAETGSPNALSRRRLSKRFGELCKKAKHISFCTGKNMLANTAIRFILFGMNMNSYSVDTLFETAHEKAIEKAC